MSLMKNTLASCLLLAAITAYVNAKENTTTSDKPAKPIFIPVPIMQPGSYPMQPGRYPVQPLPIKPLKALPARPVKALPVQPVKALPVQPVKALPVLPLTDAAWPGYYPYHRPSNEMSQVMNILGNANDYYEPLHYMVPITEEKAKNKNQKGTTTPKSKGKEASQEQSNEKSLEASEEASKEASEEASKEASGETSKESSPEDMLLEMLLDLLQKANEVIKNKDSKKQK